jgi:transcriptional regulator with XRE-family HTH domain
MSAVALRIALREKRDEAGLTQTELAEKAGVRQATISQIESGTTRIELDVLERIAAVLKVRRVIEKPGDLLVEGESPLARGK